MVVKTFNYSQFADLRIEGVGIHASFSINLTVREENFLSGKEIHISATGKTNAAKAAGSGNVLFWCKVKDILNNKVYTLDRNKGECFLIGGNDVLIGSTTFQLKRKSAMQPRMEIEAGYIYNSGYMGSASPIPSKIRKIIVLTPFGRD